MFVKCHDLNWSLRSCPGCDVRRRKKSCWRKFAATHHVFAGICMKPPHPQAYDLNITWCFSTSGVTGMCTYNNNHTVLLNVLLLVYHHTRNNQTINPTIKQRMIKQHHEQDAKSFERGTAIYF